MQAALEGEMVAVPQFYPFGLNVVYTAVYRAADGEFFAQVAQLGYECLEVRQVEVSFGDFQVAVRPPEPFPFGRRSVRMQICRLCREPGTWSADGKAGECYQCV